MSDEPRPSHAAPIEQTATSVPTCTPDDLARFITDHAIDAVLHREIGATPTVPAAARALGVHPDQIVKTLLFIIERPARQDTDATSTTTVVISHGERRVDKRALGEHFGVSRKRVKLAPADVVLTMLGYPAGGVPPFGHRTTLPVLLDASLVALHTAPHPATGEDAARLRIFAGGGDDRTMLELRLEELLRVTRPTILPLSENDV